MEATALSIRLLMNALWLLLLTSLEAQTAAGCVLLDSPLFPVMEGDDVTLRCRNEMPLYNFTADFYKDNILFKSSDTGNLTLHSVLKSDEGLYKCIISGAGESHVVALNVQAGAVILEGPAHPVMEGHSVTLRCRNNKNPTKRIADFYKHGTYFRTGYTGETTIHSVSKSDEGFYKCSISGFGDSPERWLHVKAMILESPALPVMEGEVVTLRCGDKMNANATAYFYKDGLFIGSSSTGNITIQSISKSDEGYYKCQVSGGQATSENWLAVRECPKKTTPLCNDQLPVLLYLVIRTIVTVIWVAVLLLVLGKHHWGKDRDIASGPRKKMIGHPKQNKNKYSFFVM